MPRAAARPQVAVPPFLELEGEALDPAVQGRGVDGDAPVGEPALEVAGAERELPGPAPRQRMTAAGQRQPRNIRARS